MRFLTGMIFGLLCVGLGLYVVLKSGRIDFSASHKGRFDAQIDEALDEASMASITHHAPKTTNPFGSDPKAIAAGLDHFRENCVVCHSAKGVEATEIAKGLNPAPPMLDMADSQKLTDGELFWVISNGVRATGMPAFGPTHKPEEIWHIVSFVRHLPHLTPAESAELAPHEEEDHHHHD